jgi:hypothetical protein
MGYLGKLKAATAGGGMTMGWLVNQDFGDVVLEGFTTAQPWSIYGKNMWLARPTEIVDGDYFKVVKLRLVTDGVMEMNVQVLDENGAPLPGVALAQGWVDGKELSPDSIPNGGDPRSKPNKGGVDFTNAQGQVKWGWGGGEGFAPEQNEGPHWYWVPMGPAGLYTDVVYGFGWRYGTNHYHVAPVFQRSKDILPPADDPWAVLADLFSDLSNAFEDASVRLGVG